MRIPSVPPPLSVCPACRKPLIEGKTYLSRWCNMLDYFDWVACEDLNNYQIESDEAEESDFYHEPQCKECQYWFKEPEDLKRHQQEGHAHAA